MRVFAFITMLLLSTSAFAGTLKGTVEWDNGKWSCHTTNYKGKSLFIKGVFFEGAKRRNGEARKWYKVRKTIAPGDAISRRLKSSGQIDYVRRCWFDY